ncbi:MAG: YybH family protein [Pseudomonadota bacterium]
MKTMTRYLLLTALAALFSSHVFAQSKPDPHAQHAKPSANSPVMDVLQAAQPAVDIVDRFGKSLASGDLKAVGGLLDPAVLILESGGAERSREEYLGHHAIADAAFLKSAHQQIRRRTARISGDMAWVGTESELHATRDGKATTMLSTETMVLMRTSEGWRIVHIHWSSRPKR